jgi:surface-anchored protein
MKPLPFLLLAGGIALAADPVRLTNQHVDIRISDNPSATNRIHLRLRDADSGISYLPDEAVLEVRPSARNDIPPGFEIFGPVGSPLWILPQSQDLDLLYLGFSAEGLPTSTFHPDFFVRLIQVDGPGHFFVWQFDLSANLVMFMNSRDGLDPLDTVPNSIGSHQHFNIGFTAEGLYQVTFRVSYRLAGSHDLLESADQLIRFGVVPYQLPNPPEPATLSQPRWSNSLFQLQLSGTAGAFYRIESSPNLDRWETVLEIQTNRSGFADLELPALPDFQFFRAVPR